MILSKVKVIATGSNRTRLINKLNNEKIVIYNLVTNEKTTFWIKQNDIKQLKEFSDIYGISLEIVSSTGLTKILFNVYKNLPYMIAVMLFSIVLIVCSQFVYNVKVEATNDIYANKVETLLKENNFSGRILKKKINLKEVENLILNSVNEVSFATCYIEGFSLKVKIIANDPPKSAETKSDLTSLYDGVVTRVIVRSGTSEVMPGQTVKAGEILIGGYHIADNTPSDGEESGERYEVSADGEVYGKVYTHKRFVIPKRNYAFVKTGKSTIKRQLGFNNLTILKSGKSPYEFYETQTREIRLFGILPIKIVTIEYFEMSRVEIEQNAYIESLKNKFDSEFMASMNSDSKLLAKNYEIKEVEGVKYLDIFYETEQRLDNGGHYY